MKSIAIATSIPFVYPKVMHVRLPAILLLVFCIAACSTAPKPADGRPPAARGSGFSLLNPFGRKKEPAPPASSTEVAFTPPPKRSLTDRILRPFGGGENNAEPRKTGLQLTVTPDDVAPSLGGTGQLGLRITITNYTSKLVSLTFPTAQRIEIVGRAQDGKIFYTYSANRSFANEVSILTVNPGERIEYLEAIPTRAMTAGRTYVLTASLVGSTTLEGTASINPIP